MSSTASTSFPSISGPSTARVERDLEAQITPCTWERVPSTIPIPAPTRTHSPHASVEEESTDPIDDFFGASRPRYTGTRDSRHDDARSSTFVDPEALPSYEYATASEPPAYSNVSDTPTLAMYLFKFGFRTFLFLTFLRYQRPDESFLPTVFPLFWFAGAFILLSPLRAPEDWESSKPEYERHEIIESMRRAELKWARRCLVASLVLTLAALAIALTAFFVMRS